MNDQYLNKTPIEKIVDPVKAFLHKEYASGLILLLSVVAALIWVNIPGDHSYHDLWHRELGISLGSIQFKHSLHVWINDGLMVIFFFLIGLELKREFMVGELSTFRKAMLPMTAALGGMLIPALIYFGINAGRDSVGGWGIPMATDIAFALALLSMAGKHIPKGVKVFLSALAVADDLGAVIVIAAFYTDTIFWMPLLIGGLLLVLMFIMNMLGVRSPIIYSIIGIAIWICFLQSGVHATIAGVLTAFCIPARTKIDEQAYVHNLQYYTEVFREEAPLKGPLMTQEQHEIIQKIKNLSLDAETPLQKLESSLHPWVAFIIMPLFALSNAGVQFSGDFLQNFKNPVSLGIIGGLLLGKFIGVLGFSFILIRSGAGSLPEGAGWKHIAGVAMLAGVGFTMSLFISNLAFSNEHYVENAKYGILLASLIAGLAGLLYLKNIRGSAAG